MLIQVDWYVITGKWKYGGIVDVGEAKLFRGEIMQAVIDNQKELVKDWYRHSSYIVVTSDTPENAQDPNYRDFVNALFMPSSYSQLRRSDERFDVSTPGSSSD